MDVAADEVVGGIDDRGDFEPGDLPRDVVCCGGGAHVIIEARDEPVDDRARDREVDARFTTDSHTFTSSPSVRSSDQE